MSTSVAAIGLDGIPSRWSFLTLSVEERDRTFARVFLIEGDESPKFGIVSH